jgi:hypothetical protein
VKYTVTWLPSALNQLADVWNRAADRNAVTAASDAIDRDLERDPLGIGESRSGATRIHIVAPLAVYYDVDPGRRAVTVWALWSR